MGTRTVTRRTTIAVCVSSLLLAALTFGAAPRASNSGSTQGVTKDEIKVGIAIIDYDSISDFLDYTHGPQQEVAQSFVDYINRNGGVLGRKIVPVYKTYPPIPGRQPDPLSLCTSWAEDDKVFAVLGVFIDFTGQGMLCLTREHHIVHIGHELQQQWIDEAPGGLMLTEDSTKEGSAAVLVNLLAETGRLKARKVGVLVTKNGEPAATGTIMPALKDHKIKTAPTSVLTVTGPYSEATRSQLDAFIEKWKAEDVDTVFLSGLDTSSKSIVSQIKTALPKALLVTDADATLQQARDEVAAGVEPNPYEGMLSTTGLTQSERWADKSPLLQKCVDIYEKASGTKVRGPEDEQVNDNGKAIQTDVAVTDFCGELFMFRDIAEKVGPKLTTANWQKTVNNFGTIDLVPTPIASLCKGKYAATDAFRLVSFDSSLGTSGDWKKVTPIRDASGGRCATTPTSGG
jgi:ABC-type branched-subunit amino acid transport system substrate-binding protein